MKCDCGEDGCFQTFIDFEGDEIAIDYCKKCKRVFEFSIDGEEYKAGEELL